MIVLKLTTEQKALIEGQEYAPNSLFNPIQDGNEPPNWVITTQEAEQCTNPDFQWVKELPLIPWVAPEPIETDEAN